MASHSPLLLVLGLALCCGMCTAHRHHDPYYMHELQQTQAELKITRLELSRERALNDLLRHQSSIRSASAPASAPQDAAPKTTSTWVRNLRDLEQLGYHRRRGRHHPCARLPRRRPMRTFWRPPVRRILDSPVCRHRRGRTLDPHGAHRHQLVLRWIDGHLLAACAGDMVLLTLGAAAASLSLQLAAVHLVQLQPRPRPRRTPRPASPSRAARPRRPRPRGRPAPALPHRARLHATKRDSVLCWGVWTKDR